MINFRFGRTLIVGAVSMIGMTLPNVAFSRATLAVSGETKTLDCAGGPARITGANNKVTLRGDCTHLTVLGSGNTITAEFAAGASITFAGSRNQVAWTTADGKEPHVRRFGLSSRRLAWPATVGSGNTLKKRE
jgi:hypothetical protein